MAVITSSIVGSNQHYIFISKTSVLTPFELIFKCMGNRSELQFILPEAVSPAVEAAHAV